MSASSHHTEDNNVDFEQTVETRLDNVYRTKNIIEMLEKPST